MNFYVQGARTALEKLGFGVPEADPNKEYPGGGPYPGNKYRIPDWYWENPASPRAVAYRAKHMQGII
jgi:hypothetical protein